MYYISNAFALSMLSEVPVNIRVSELSAEEVRKLLAENEFTSTIGHQSTSLILSELLQMQISMNRVQIKLSKNDKLIVYQLMQRVEEGKILTREEILQLSSKFFFVEII
jgi:hypothetical protein